MTKTVYNKTNEIVGYKKEKIRIKNARIQAAFITTVIDITREKVLKLIKGYTQGLTCDLFGEPKINIFSLNLTLDSFLSVSFHGR